MFPIILNIGNYIPRISTVFIETFLNAVHDRTDLASNITIMQLFAVVLLFLLPRSRRKLQCVICFVIGTAAFHIPIVDYLFNAFVERNNRWVFFYHFALSVILVVVVTELKEIVFCTEQTTVKFTRDKMLIASGLMLSLNLIIGMWSLYTSVNTNWQWDFISYEDSYRYIDSPVNYSEVIRADKDVYRIANSSLTNINGRPENIAMLNDYYGLTYWFSVVNQYTMQYANTLNEDNKSWRSYGFNNNSVYESFAGVKYYMTNNPQNMDDAYVLAEKLVFNDENWYLYENTRYFGMAYLRNYDDSMDAWNNRSDYEQYYSFLAESGYGYVNGVNYDNIRNEFRCYAEASDGENELVVLLPYNGNWKAWVDGEKVNIGRADLSYLSIPLEEGNHEIVIRYTSYAVAVGIVLMIIGIGLCILLYRERA